MSSRLLLAVLLLVGLAATACGQSSTAADAPAAAGAGVDDTAFPVTIPNTFGSTTIDAKPERIVTLGWNAQDVVYALGLTPVAMPKYTYGADPNGVMAWDEPHYDAAKTTLLDTSDGAPFEEIAKARPDVILAPYEGFDAATYKKLSAIAPTVAYPDKAWQTSWEDQTTIIGKALGLSPKADELVASTKAEIAAAAADHPEFAGKSLSVAYFGKPEINVYMPTDPRVQLLDQLGFVDSDGVKALAKANKAGDFYSTVAWENVSTIDADVVVGYIDDLTLAEFEANKLAAELGAVRHDADYILSDTKVIAALSQPTVLSVGYTLEQVLPDLSRAATNAK